MKNLILTALSITFITAPAFAAAPQTDGLINIQSPYSVDTTAKRIEKILNKKGLTIFSVINHAKNAKRIGIELRDTKLIIFGNPKIGTRLIKCQQSTAIDLPLKALIWKDSVGKTWVSYNDIRYIEKRHNITGCDKYITKIENALAKIIKKSTSKPAQRYNK